MNLNPKHETHLKLQIFLRTGIIPKKGKDKFLEQIIRIQKANYDETKRNLPINKTRRNYEN